MLAAASGMTMVAGAPMVGGATIYAASAMVDEASYRRKTELLEGYSREYGITVVLANYAGVTGGDQSAGRSAIWHAGSLLASIEDAGEGLVVATRGGCEWSGYALPFDKKTLGGLEE